MKPWTVMTVSEHVFCDAGFDVWGYDRDGKYDSTYDRAPFQNSPYPNEHRALDGEPNE